MATILVVDDRPINREFLVTLLEYGGHRILEAEDGVDALECVRSENPDLIITDILMPTMDGVEFARQLHADPSIAHTPMIFYTATYRSNATSILAPPMGVAAVLPKPSEPQVILDTVHAALGLPPAAPRLVPPLLHQEGSSGRTSTATDRLSAHLSELEELNLAVVHAAEHGLKLVGGRTGQRSTAGEISRSLTNMQTVSLRLSALVEFGLSMASHYDPLYLLEASCRTAQNILSAKYAAVGVLDETGDGLKHLFVRGMGDEAKQLLASLHPRAGLLGRALAEGRPQRADSFGNDPQQVGLPASHPPFNAFLAVPIVLPDGPFGWLYLADKLGDEAFDADDERFAMTLAAQLAGAQENLLLNEQLRRHSESLEREVEERKRVEYQLQKTTLIRSLLARCNQVMLYATDEAELLRDMCRAVVDTGGYPMLWIGAPNGEAPGSVHAVARATLTDGGSGNAAPGEMENELSNYLAGVAIRVDRPYVVQDIAGEPSLERWRKRIDMSGFRSAIALPLQVDLGPRWALVLYDALPAAFDREQLAMLEELADDIAYGIATMRTRAERARAERRLAAQFAIANALVESDTLAEAAPRLLQAIGESIGWDAGELWTVDDGPQCLRWTAAWHRSPVATEDFGNISRQATFAPGDGLPGRVWAAKKPLWVADVSRDRNFRRQIPAADAGLRAAMGFPVLLENKVIGVMTLFGARLDEPEEDLIRLLASTGDQVGIFVQRKRAMAALQESERRFSDMLGKVELVSMMLDRDARITYCNDHLLRRTGWRREDVLGRDWFEIFVPPEIGAMKDLFNSLLKDVPTAWHHENEILTRHGERRLIRWNNSVLRSTSGEVIGTASIGEDITERVQAEAALHAADEKLRDILESIDSVVWSISAANYELLYLNPAAERVYGRPVTDFYEHNDLWSNAVHPEDRGRVLGILSELFEKRSLTLEYRIVRPDGEVRWLEDKARVVYGADETPLRLDGIASDITERKIHEARIEHLANHDALTDLPNRNLLNDRIAQSIAHARRAGQRLALLFLDLDRFKFLNDSFGHTLGDAVLKVVASRLKDAVRADDTVARLGGDEFVVMLPGLAHAQDAANVAQKILNEFARALRVENREVYVTASIGVSLYPDDGDEADTLLKNADAAMYRAKEQGRNNFQFYTREMGILAQERAALESALRIAVQGLQFELHYQPQVSLKSGAITGVEALIRWHHPELGTVSPALFIPLAEETGLIFAIGDWVLRTACQQMKAWHTAGYSSLSIAVNVSGRQVRQRHLPETVRRVLQDTGLEPDRLDIELTESTMMQDTETVVETLRELKAIGVSLSMDDFGTGYSSLGYLKRFPIDVVKIDQSFISELTTNAGGAALTRAIIAMSRSLNMKSIAEGVETEGQAALLVANRCDEMQGYFFSRPVPAAELEMLLREGRRLPDHLLLKQK